MITYIVRRLGSMLAVLVGISIITFLIAYAIPGDPARVIVGMHATKAVVEAVRHNLGLDRPLYVQYLIYVDHLVHGNLGYSYVTQQPVWTLISQRIGNTAALAFGGWLVELIIGIPLGILSAVRHRKPLDYTVSLLALIAISLPQFWFGMWLIYNIGYHLGILPISGTGGIRHLILPSITLGVTGLAFYQRLVKASMIGVLREDFIRTAHSVGVGPLRVVRYHALRNALIPTFTYAGIDIAQLLGGVVLVETVFGYPGIGLLAYQSIQNMDIPVIMGTVLLTAVFVVVTNFVVDLLYLAIDPRISFR